MTDLLNETLTPQKFVIIRYEATFAVHPIDEKIDPTTIPRVEPEDLSRRGKSEIVRCNIGPLSRRRPRPRNAARR